MLSFNSFSYIFVLFFCCFFVVVFFFNRVIQRGTKFTENIKMEKKRERKVLIDIIVIETEKRKDVKLNSMESD